MTQSTWLELCLPEACKTSLQDHIGGAFKKGRLKASEQVGDEYKPFSQLVGQALETPHEAALY